MIRLKDPKSETIANYLITQNLINKILKFLLKTNRYYLIAKQNKINKKITKETLHKYKKKTKLDLNCSHLIYLNLERLRIKQKLEDIKHLEYLKFR